MVPGGFRSVHKSALKIIFVFLLLPAFVSARERQCRAVFGDYDVIAKLSQKELSSVKPNFQHDEKYTKEIDVGDIKDQCSWGSCWAFSMTSELEGLARTMTGKKIKLDPEYTVALQVIMRGLQAVREYGHRPSQGEWLPYALMLAKKFGLVPVEAWHPRVDISSKAISSRVDFFIGEIVRKYQVEYVQLDAQLVELAQKTKGKKPSDSDVKRAKNLQAAQGKIMEAAQLELMSLLESLMGPLPESFVYEGRTMTPVEFANEYFQLDQTGLLQVEYNGPELPVPRGFYGTRDKSAVPRLENVLSGQVSMELMEKIVVNEIDQGRPVWLSVNWEDAFVDKKSGIMSIGAFHTPFDGKKLDRTYIDTFGPQAGHAVVIVGYDKDADGNIVKFKIHNSWGAKVGSMGFFHMYRDFFEAFANRLALLMPVERLKEVSKAKTPDELLAILKAAEPLPVASLSAKR
jgi:bleomycin hydrolase